ncbi:MAG: peptidylprolyl isomerase, partial [Candidatus Acidiferrum sp.]
MIRRMVPLLALFAVVGAVRAETPRRSQERAVFNTPGGDIVFVFYPDVAPNTVRQFLRLVGEGVYDSTYFGRLEANFVLQLFTAEDRRVPLTERQANLLKPIKAEFSKLPHRRGILSMARLDGDVDSASSSFSILLGPAPHLDGKYTIFGEVEKGMDVVDELCKVPVEGNKPKIRLEVAKAIVVASPRQLSELNLVAAHPVDLSALPAAHPPGSEIPLAFAGGIILIVGGGTLCFFLSDRLPR